MARLIPPVYIDNHSSGEEKIFRAFERDSFSKDWIVLHSFDLPKHSSQGEGEVDFVILIHGCGVFCMEVKASEKIARKGGIWRYGSGNYRDARGPFKQVKDNTFSLMRRIKSGNPELKNVPFFPVVAFTNCNFRNLKIGGAKEWGDDDFVDAADFAAGNFTQKLEALFKSQAARHKLSIGDFTGEKFNKMAELLRPDFEAMLSPRERMASSEIKARRYTSEQFKILDSVMANDRIIVDGLAGTGKTAMAIEYARRMSKTCDVLFITPIAPLGRHLSAEAMLEYPRHFAGSSEKFLRKFEELKAAHPQGFGFLVLDEAQDFVGREIFEKFNEILKGGILNGKWIMFGDYFSKPRDSSAQEKIDAFKNKFRPAVCRLTYNCRNPESVARLAANVAGFASGYGNYLKSDSGEASGLRIFACEDLDMYSAKIASVLEGLLAEGAPQSSIAILSMRPDMPCLEKLFNSRVWGARLSKGSEGGKITCAHVGDFKGLERDFVLLVGADNLAEREARRMFYIGATRAKTCLFVFASPAAAKELERLA
ncbi:MAG: NERD domain-containing protein [Opitutales bacterium]|nr:NERD domain-containing protein [Opitutales bacterium]